MCLHNYIKMFSTYILLAVFYWIQNVEWVFDWCIPMKRSNLITPFDVHTEHATDKPWWMTSNIRAEIKYRQRAFTRGNMDQYALPCMKVRDVTWKEKWTITRTKLKHYVLSTLDGIKPFIFYPEQKFSRMACLRMLCQKKKRLTWQKNSNATIQQIILISIKL